MSEKVNELTVVDYAEKAGQLNDGTRITLEGVIKGDIKANKDGKVEFDGKDDITIKTEFDEEADITKTKISIEEPSLKEGIQATEKIGELLWKIKDEIENKLDKTATATSAEKLSKGKNISLEGNVTGTVVFDGSKDVEIQTEITGGDIKDTVVSYIEEISDKEELLQDEKISKILGKIKRSLKELDEHIGDKNNPHGVSKEQLGLENVENTKDINKPISNATKQALAFKDVMGITTNKERGYYYLKTKIPYEINEFVRCDLQINGLQNCCIDLKIMMYVSNYYNDIKDYVAYSIGTNYYGNIHVFFDDDNLLVIGIPLLYNYQQVRGSAYYTYKAENKTGENLLTGEVFIEQSDYIKGKKRKVSFPVITNNDINIFSNNKINSCVDGSNEEWNTKSKTEYIEDLGYYVLKLTTPHHYFKSNMIEVFPNELYEFNFGVQTLSNISKKYGIHIGLTEKQNFKVYIYDYESREWVFEKYNTNAYFLIEYGLSQRKYFTTYILGSKILIQDIPSPKYTDTEQDLRCIQLVDNDTRCQIRSGYNSGQEEGTSWYLINPHLRRIRNEGNILTRNIQENKTLRTKEIFIGNKINPFISVTKEVEIKKEGWYTFAKVGQKDIRASAQFTLTLNTPWDHQSIHFIATHMYSNGNSIMILSNSAYNKFQCVRNIRIVYNDIYDGALLQVYVKSLDIEKGIYPIQAYMTHNASKTGWELCDFLETEPIKGLVKNHTIDVSKCENGIHSSTKIIADELIESPKIMTTTQSLADKSTNVATTKFVHEMFKAYKEGRLNL